MDISSLNKLVLVEPTATLDKRHVADTAPALEMGASESNAPLDPSVTAENAAINSHDALQKNERETSKKIDTAVTAANHFFEQVSRELRFERSDVDGSLVIKVTDKKTGEVIRQIPSDEMLKISRDLENITGLLFKDSA